MPRSFLDRASVVLMALGAVGSGTLTRRMRGDIGLQNQLATPLWITVLIVFYVLTLSALFVWGWSSKRRPWLLAVIVTTVLNIAMLFLATSVGWLGGTAFRPSSSLQLLVYGAAFVWLVAVPLACYRWMALRFSRLWALLGYLGWVAFLSLVTIPVEHGWLAAGTYVFGHGYTMSTDILWGVLMYAVALGLFLLIERCRKVNPCSD